MTGKPLVLGIDPGDTESAFALIDAGTCKPRKTGKVPNRMLLELLRSDTEFNHASRVAIEMVASYGMPVGETVFETVVWIGRFQQALVEWRPVHYSPVLRTKRLPVKMHHCHDSKAKDSNITQALIDRFAAGEPNRGKGTRDNPGWFHGFAKDIWQAYALAVYTADADDPPF